MIEGVVFKDLVTHTDERGFFRELIRSTDSFFEPGFGQLSHSLVYTGVIKAWHAHKVQFQWNYVITGSIKVALHDLRSQSPTFHKTLEFLVGENQPVRVYGFPPGVAHGYKCLHGPMNIIYVTSGQYDSEDEVQIPYDDTAIGYDWLKAFIK
ncbi:MAG: dTDP-4-dehydrorhamnose 3,5-epimerase family protein [Anaerolineaceae bacterium]|nr:dTDP-4-dehydrorhamnose 3,5-epimerase family protein [Anaerolineaceae bacterium]